MLERPIDQAQGALAETADPIETWPLQGAGFGDHSSPEELVPLRKARRVLRLRRHRPLTRGEGVQVLEIQTDPRRWVQSDAGFPLRIRLDRPNLLLWLLVSGPRLYTGLVCTYSSPPVAPISFFRVVGRHLPTSRHPARRLSSSWPACSRFALFFIAILAPWPPPGHPWKTIGKLDEGPRRPASPRSSTSSAAAARALDGPASSLRLLLHLSIRQTAGRELNSSFTRPALLQPTAAHAVVGGDERAGRRGNQLVLLTIHLDDAAWRRRIRGVRLVWPTSTDSPGLSRHVITESTIEPAILAGRPARGADPRPRICTPPPRWWPS